MPAGDSAQLYSTARPRPYRERPCSLRGHGPSSGRWSIPPTGCRRYSPRLGATPMMIAGGKRRRPQCACSYSSRTTVGCCPPTGPAYRVNSSSPSPTRAAAPHSSTALTPPGCRCGSPPDAPPQHDNSRRGCGLAPCLATTERPPSRYHPAAPRSMRRPTRCRYWPGPLPRAPPGTPPPPERCTRGRRSSRARRRRTTATRGWPSAVRYSTALSIRARRQTVDEIPIIARPVERFAELLDSETMSEFTATMDLARQRLAGRTVWHVNSTAEGGGVAEMLQSVLSYAADSEIDVRWLVIEADAAFFDVTKRLHHLLHGSPGDGGPLGPTERHVYESTLAAEAGRLAGLISPGDPVVLHDPQTLGLAPALAAAGAQVVWSCHIGTDEANEHSRAAWQFLDRYADSTNYQVFSRPEYAWENLDRSRITIIPPCIDAFTAKNQPLTHANAAAILDAAAVIPLPTADVTPTFTRPDQTTG